MRTGAGIMASLPDSWLLALQQREMIPHFRFGDHEAGIERGAHLILDRLEGRPASAIQGKQVESGQVVAPTVSDVLLHRQAIEQGGGRGGFGAGRVQKASAASARLKAISPSRVGEDGNPFLNHAMIWAGAAIVGLVVYQEWKTKKERRRRLHLCLACNALDSTESPRAKELASVSLFARPSQPAVLVENACNASSR